uniref:Uncharacterized protein n=1 Tax=viral metagenome TaxID=1070528 RepID=A0A6C0HRD2_9ZZZZ
MIILLRGHIRNSFDDSRLYHFIKQLSFVEPIKIYIHTWNVKQSNVSWRDIKVNNTKITEEFIKTYFNDLKDSISKIIIDNDKNNKLVGQLRGNVSLSVAPKIGWKNMWYGKKRIIDEIGKHELINERIINLRFDIFSNSNPFNMNISLNFIKTNTNIGKKNIFLFNREKCGIDNIYIGNFNTMFNLIYHFHYNLDYILTTNFVYNQEFLVFRENHKMRI